MMNISKDNILTVLNDNMIYESILNIINPAMPFIKLVNNVTYGYVDNQDKGKEKDFSLMYE
jgi:hypothetical protein